MRTPSGPEPNSSIHIFSSSPQTSPINIFHLEAKPFSRISQNLSHIIFNSSTPCNCLATHLVARCVVRNHLILFSHSSANKAPLFLHYFLRSENCLRRTCRRWQMDVQLGFGNGLTIGFALMQRNKLSSYIGDSGTITQ